MNRKLAAEGSRDGAVVRALASQANNVARVRFSDSASCAGCFCRWFSFFFREVFLRVLRFSPLLKTNIFKFQFDLENCEALYHKPQAQRFAQELPMLLTLNKLPYFTFLFTNLYFLD